VKIKEAVAIAKQHIQELFADEGITDIALEEVEPHLDSDDPRENLWKITIGFTRPWDAPGAAGLAMGLPRRRTYKIVDISDADGKVTAVWNREVA
jgi:hypothetical protein